MVASSKVTLTGGKLFARYLEKLARNMKDPPNLKVGFLDSHIYENTGLNTATVGWINEFGATVSMPDRQQTIYKKVNSKGTGFLRKGRFVKTSQANFSTTHEVKAHTYTIPPRPFFRNMIAAKKGEWGGDAAKIMKANELDIKKTADLMGQLITGQLQKSIQSFSSPPNAPSTVRKKGFNDPLIDTGQLWSHADYNVD